jgi:hypothetical protein
MKSKANSYLDYLDKEMTIMGLLSTFCVAVVALVIDRVGSADLSKNTLFAHLWGDQGKYVLLGSLCMAIASVAFYLQRSALAWFYGQISLSIESPAINGTDTEAWYKDADSWSTWVPYQSAFAALTVGCAFYSYALMTASSVTIPAWLLWAPIAVGIPIHVVRMFIFRHYKYEEDPIGQFLRMLRPRSRQRGNGAA